jgi:hypothetical protein
MADNGYKTEDDAEGMEEEVDEGVRTTLSSSLCDTHHSIRVTKPSKMLFSL